MKVRTVYPDNPLPENEWYQYIYNLLTQPYDKKTGRPKSIHANKRRTGKDRGQKQLGGQASSPDQ